MSNRPGQGYKNAVSIISVALQPPLNKLFVPRVPLDPMPPTTALPSERRPISFDAVTQYLDYLTKNSPEVVEHNYSSKDLRRQKHKAYLREAVSKWRPKDNKEATRDPFKTLFVGRLPYGISEETISRIFSRYGTVTEVIIVRDKPKDEPLTTEQSMGALIENQHQNHLDEDESDMEIESNDKPSIQKEINFESKISKGKSIRRGACRGYAFVQFERERDMRVAYQEADGMRVGINGITVEASSESRRIIVDVERGRTVPDWKPRRLGGGLGMTRKGPKAMCVKPSGRDSRAEIKSSTSSSRSHTHHQDTRGGYEEDVVRDSREYESQSKRSRSNSHSHHR